MQNLPMIMVWYPSDPRAMPAKIKDNFCDKDLEAGEIESSETRDSSVTAEWFVFLVSTWDTGTASLISTMLIVATRS